ncbi:DUF4192 domain-containing protein [Allorhizocola rhizosphaerae]|uniref:DUF4192 domain-containing protein n=1 Tax=Allorhizocola rhizosphaerae TaxID=1872709 RepID=UPI0013C2A082|nr:DUF4192 domain-containing protein [Allorhizocola rhizosphaerae]
MKQLEVRINSREELLGYVPYALGFHPADSIVLLGITRRRLLGMTARVDADQPTREITRALCVALRRKQDVCGLFLFGYGPEPISGPMQTVARDLRARNYLVHEVLRVADGRYHCLDCNGCTAPAGRPFDVATSVAATAMTVAGAVARPTRDDVEKLVRPIGGLAAASMRQAVDRAEQRFDGVRDNAVLLELGRHAVDEAFARAKDRLKLSDDEVAWLSVLMVDTKVRDHAWWLTDGRDWQLEFWLEMTRRAEPVLAAPMASLLAWCAWRQGDGGPLAIAALERAMRIDPGYDLAQMLSELISQAYPPETIPHWPPQPSRTGER